MITLPPPPPHPLLLVTEGITYLPPFYEDLVLSHVCPRIIRIIVCLHVPIPSPSPSSFIIVLMVMVCPMGKIGVEPILPNRRSVTISTIIKLAVMVTEMGSEHVNRPYCKNFILISGCPHREKCSTSHHKPNTSFNFLNILIFNFFKHFPWVGGKFPCVNLYFSGGSKGARGTRTPPGPKFLYFHAVFEKNWPNNRLAPPLWG